MTSLENEQSNVCSNNSTNEDEISCAQRKLDFILSQTQRLSKTGNWEFDLKTQATQWSDEMFNIHGLSREFNTNDYHAVLELYEEPSRQLFLDAGAKLFREKTPFDITARVRTPFGHIKWVRVLGFPRTENDVVTGITGITSDITAQKTMEHLLKASEAKFQKTFRNSSDLMALMREDDMVIVDVNDSVLPMLGYTREELIGNVTPGFRFYKDPADREKFLKTYFHKGVAEMECRWMKKTGESLRVFLKGTRIEINSQPFFLIVIRDLEPRANIIHPNPIQPTAKLNRLLRQLEMTNDDPLSKLALPSADGFIFIRPKEIIFCEADGNYTQVHLVGNRKQVITKTLKDFEELLPDEFFFRTHNSYIINLSYIKKYNKGEGTLTMENGATLDVAKRKKLSFLDRIGIARNQLTYPLQSINKSDLEV